eukprot:scaffold263757_cov18-Tisochrysis_lutea.AAC.1
MEEAARGSLGQIILKGLGAHWTTANVIYLNSLSLFFSKGSMLGASAISKILYSSSAEHLESLDKRLKVTGAKGLQSQRPTAILYMRAKIPKDSFDVPMYSRTVHDEWKRSREPSGKEREGQECVASSP